MNAEKRRRRMMPPWNSEAATDRIRPASATGSGMELRSISKIAEQSELARIDNGGKFQDDVVDNYLLCCSRHVQAKRRSRCGSDIEMSWRNRRWNGTDHIPRFRQTRRPMPFLDSLEKSRRAEPKAMNNLRCRFLGRIFMPVFCKTVSNRTISIIELPSRSKMPGTALTMCPAAIAHRAIQFGPMGSLVATRARVISV